MSSNTIEISPASSAQQRNPAAVGKGVVAITNFWPPMAAGTGHTLRGMMEGLGEAVVLAPRVSGLEAGGSLQVIPTLRFSGKAGGPFKLFSILQHAEIILTSLLWCARPATRPSLLVCVQPLFAGVGGLLSRLLFGVPYLTLVHGEELTLIVNDRALLGIRRRLQAAALRRSTAVICNSENTRRLVAELYNLPVQRLEVINPSIDVTEFSALPDPAALGALRSEITPARHILLMVGRLAETHKGFDTAIEALPGILKEVPDTTLLIAGPGSQERLAELARSLGVQDRVRFLGLVDREKLLALYAVCDVFLLPGRHVQGSAEGFGIVYLEASVAGKPVIGGREGGVPEAVADGETGLLVDGASVAEVARAAIRLLRDPAYAQRLGSAGHRRVMERFDGRAQRASFARLVDRVLQQAVNKAR